MSICFLDESLCPSVCKSVASAPLRNIQGLHISMCIVSGGSQSLVPILLVFILHRYFFPCVTYIELRAYRAILNTILSIQLACTIHPTFSLFIQIPFLSVPFLVFHCFFLTSRITSKSTIIKGAKTLSQSRMSIQVKKEFALL